MSKFLKVIVNLFLVFAILVAGAILVPPVLGVSTTMIDSASMDTNLPVGSITYSQNISVTELAAGDKILYEADNSVNVYVVETADAVSGKFVVSDESDPQAEVQELTLRNEALKVMLTVPFIGYLMVAMHSVEGLIIIGLVVLFVIILFILSELWKKSDDDEEEDEDDDEDEYAADRYAAEPSETSDGEAVAEDTAQASESETDGTESPEADSEEDAAEALEIPVVELSSEELAQSVTETLKEDAIEESETEESETGESETAEETVEETEEETVEEASATFVKVARPTLDEIVIKAETAGDKPKIVSYDAFGVTVVDFSDCI